MEANGTLTFKNLAKVCVPELSKDDATGDVTIRYSSPEGLPFSFEWTATVKVDGTRMDRHGQGRRHRHHDPVPVQRPGHPLGRILAGAAIAAPAARRKAADATLVTRHSSLVTRHWKSPCPCPM